MKVLVLNPGSKQTTNVVRDLIYGCWCKGKRIGGMQAPPLNLLYISTVLQDAGHKVQFYDALVEGKPLEEIKNSLLGKDFVIISTSTMSFREDCQTLAGCKRINPNIKTIIFGSHPTFMPEESLADPIDFIIKKEPEYIIKELIDCYAKGDGSWRTVLGIGYQEYGKKVINRDAPFVAFGEFPIPDRSFLSKDVDYFNPLVKKIPYTTMMTSRGCVAKCSYCTVPNFYGNKLRFKSAEKVLEELELIQAQGYKEVWIRDETFTAYPKRNREICREILRRNIKLSWFCNARAGTITESDMRLMKRAGCHMIKFGVESGVQHILDNVKKGIKIGQTIESFKIAHKFKMDTHAHVMLGMPGDTKETIEETIRFVKKIDPTTASFGICTPYAGTPMYYDILEKHPEMGDGSSCDLSKLHESSFFNQYMTSVTAKELEKYVKKAYRAFYMRPTYLLRWLPRIKSMDEFRRILLAGSNVFSFTFEKVAKNDAKRVTTNEM